MKEETMKAEPSKKQGIYTILAAIAVQLTLGIAYIWSVFQNGIANSIFKGDHAASALTFSILLMAFSVGSMMGGRFAAKHTVRSVVFIGGLIMSAGFALASFLTEDFAWLLWVTYGVLGGGGMGFTYSTIIACAQKWYPHKRGLVSGIIVSALGFGGVIFSPIVESLIRSLAKTDSAGAAVTGSGELGSFLVLGGVFLVVCTVGSLFMKSPPEGYMQDKIAASPVKTKTAEDISPIAMIKTLRFYLITATFLLACMGGLMMIGFAKPIAEVKGPAGTAVVAVIAVSIFNSLGRLVWGAVSDKIGRINTLIILLAGSAASSLLVNAAQGYMLYVLIAFIGFFYGGIVGTYPSLTSDLFGAKNVATNYGIVLLGFGAGAIISSQIAGHFRNAATVVTAAGDTTFDISLMFPAFIIGAGCALAGVVMMVILKAYQSGKGR
ncbi:MAG: MFS transporter [Oscillospiraceae bacterium]|nr:MFS transporter [Oscillospiraceae bacterium]